MSTDPRFDVFPNQSGEPKKPRGMWANCLIGCLIVFGVLVVLGILLAVWVGRNLNKWVADFGSIAINQAISDSDLPPKEKDEMREQSARVTTALREGRISTAHSFEIFQKVMTSPLMPWLIVEAANKQYLQRSGLKEEEKAEGRLALKRFARGMVDKKIDQKQIDAVMQHVADRDANGQWRPRSIVSDQDLRAALNEAKSQADTAGIEAEPKDVDPSDELKRIIDEALAAPDAGGVPKPADVPGRAEIPAATEAPAAIEPPAPAEPPPPPPADAPAK